MIKDVESLEKYLKEHENRLHMEGQAMGRVLYLTKDSSGGLTLSQIEDILNKFDIENIKQVSWFCGAITGIYSGMLYAKDIQDIINTASN